MLIETLIETKGLYELLVFRFQIQSLNSQDFLFNLPVIFESLHLPKEQGYGDVEIVNTECILLVRSH